MSSNFVARPLAALMLLITLASSARAELVKPSDIAGVYHGEGVNFTLAVHPQFTGNRMIGMLISGGDQKVCAVIIRIEEKGLSGIVYDGSLAKPQPFTFKVEGDVLNFTYKDGTTLQLTRVRNEEGK